MMGGDVSATFGFARLRDERRLRRQSHQLYAQSMQALCCGSSPEERGNGTMAKTYRDVAIEQMIATVEESDDSHC
jgi:hypothetical protein